MSKPITKKKPETKKSKRWLRVQLSREELLVAGKEQADKLTERTRLDEDLKRIKDDFKAKISARRRPQSNAVAVARRRIGTVDYAVMSNGQMVRHRPLKPWRNKSERRQAIKARRLERSEA